MRSAATAAYSADDVIMCIEKLSCGTLGSDWIVVVISKLLSDFHLSNTHYNFLNIHISHGTQVTFRWDTLLLLFLSILGWFWRFHSLLHIPCNYLINYDQEMVMVMMMTEHSVQKCAERCCAVPAGISDLFYFPLKHPLYSNGSVGTRGQASIPS